MSKEQQPAEDVEPEKKTTPPGPNDDILRGKQLGFTDQQTADFAGIELAELRHRMATDAALITAMRRARGQGLAAQYKWLAEASQAPAHELLLKLAFPELFDEKDRSTENHPMLNPSIEEALANAISTMSLIQRDHITEILQLGIAAANKKPELIDQAPIEISCPSTTPKTLPDASSDSATSETTPKPTEASAPS